MVIAQAFARGGFAEKEAFFLHANHCLFFLNLTNSNGSTNTIRIEDATNDEDSSQSSFDNRRLQRHQRIIFWNHHSEVTEIDFLSDYKEKKVKPTSFSSVLIWCMFIAC